MSHTQVCDDSLVALENHPSLASLSLLSTNITDDGLCHLRGEILELLFGPIEARKKLDRVIYLLFIYLVTLYLPLYNTNKRC